MGHASGTKNKWMIQMVKAFVCHDSVSKFYPNESSLYVNNHINKPDTQYVMVYLLADTQEEYTSIQYDVSITMNDDQGKNSFLNKYRIKHIYLAVYSVCHGGGLFDLMETSPTYQRYGIETHMLYIIQDILHVSVKTYTLTLHCNTSLNTTYKNMVFDRYDDFDASILEYFQLDDDYKNIYFHMIFKKTSMIDTR